MRLTHTKRVTLVTVLFIIGINLHKNAADGTSNDAGTDTDDNQNASNSTFKTGQSKGNQAFGKYS